MSVDNSKKEFNIEEAKRLYLEEKRSTVEIAKIFGFKTSKSISDKLKACGVEIRTGQNLYTVSKNYSDDIFEKIDSEWKAYFLGLLLTDGWITGERTVGYSSIDRDVVEYLSLLTGKSVQIVSHEKDRKFINIQGYECNRRDEFRIILSSKKMVDDLVRLSVVSNKTHVLNGPNLEYNELQYLPQIIRGIIDGDGTFGFPSNNNKSIYFRIVSASEAFIDWCIYSLRILGMRNINKLQTRENFWELNTAQSYNIEILVNSIYRGDFGMSRKKNKLIEHYLLR